MVKIVIITYSTYGHIDVLAQAVKKGVEAAGGKADIYRVEETLPDEVLTKMNAPQKPEDIPVATEKTLLEYDAFFSVFQLGLVICRLNGPPFGIKPVDYGPRAL